MTSAQRQILLPMNVESSTRLYVVTRSRRGWRLVCEDGELGRYPSRDMALQTAEGLSAAARRLGLRSAAVVKDAEVPLARAA